MISLTPGLFQPASLDLYKGLNRDLAKKEKKLNCPQMRWALTSSKEGSSRRKTLSVRFIFNCWCVNVNHLYRIMKLEFLFFFLLNSDTIWRAARACKRREILKEHIQTLIYQNHRRGWSSIDPSEMTNEYTCCPQQFVFPPYIWTQIGRMHWLHCVKVNSWRKSFCVEGISAFRFYLE